MRATNKDLLPYSPDKPKDDPSMQRAFTQAQLIILRARDRSDRNKDIENCVYDDLAAEIAELANAWHNFNNGISSP